MALRPTEQFIFGGVDSRSNPVNYPPNRALRLRNFLLERAGNLRLRDGYKPIPMNSALPGLAHSMIGYKVLNGDRYLIFVQGTTVKILNLRTAAVATAAVNGAALIDNGRWSWYLANNRIHGVNGNNRKFLMFDGANWVMRPIGLRSPTTAEANAVGVTAGAVHVGGVPKSTVGGAQPGYVWYVSFWNRVTGQVSNRKQVGARILFTDDDHDVGFTQLPVHEDPQVDVLIGRSGDGAEVPYAVVDAAAAWVYVPWSQRTATVTTPKTDGNAELPTRNGMTPDTLSAVARVGDYIYGIVSDGPSIYRSNSGVDNVDPISNDSPPSIGRPEQSWPADNLETFPTGDVPHGIHEYNGDCWVQSLNDLAILIDQQGVPGWQGPWRGAGIAGQEAFAVGFKGLPYWITGDKQLMTMTSEGPVPISDEYEGALLSQIDDAYLSQTQVVPYRDAELQVDFLAIKGRDSAGSPFIVIHDFNARDDRSPYGQAMDQTFGDALGAEFYLANVRDNSGHARLLAGGQNGQMYQLLSGVNDNGAEFTADLIALPYLGPNRTAVPIIEWYGDALAEWYLSDTLDKSINDLDQFATLKGADEQAEEVPGDENNGHYQIQLPAPELTHAYLRIRLVSHSDDAPANGMGLNNPPHMPLETYGRVYVVAPLIGTSRGK